MNFKGFHQNFPNQDLIVLMYAPDVEGDWASPTLSDRILVAQLTSVSELSDVKTTDWAFSAL